MIKASELRCGVLLYNKDGIPFPITSEEINKAEHYNQAFNELYKPIPLDADWLERAGFKHLKQDWYEIEYDVKYDDSVIDDYMGHSVSLQVNAATNKGWLLNNTELDTGLAPAKNIQYVHQLQNLYFCLVGEELTLTGTELTITEKSK